MRSSHLITTVALVAACTAPASAVAFQDLRSPDARDAATAAQTPTGQDLRSPDAADAAAHRGVYELDRGPYVLNRDFGSPDATDVARGVTPAQVPAPVVEVRRVPSGGFDWGDAGIGAAGMLALFSIAAGSALMVMARRRRGGLRIAH